MSTMVFIVVQPFIAISNFEFFDKNTVCGFTQTIYAAKLHDIFLPI